MYADGDTCMMILTSIVQFLQILVVIARVHIISNTRVGEGPGVGKASPDPGEAQSSKVHKHSVAHHVNFFFSHIGACNHKG